MDKREARLRRARKSRSKMKELKAVRLQVWRSPRNIYAQIIASDGQVLTSASTLENEIREKCGGYGGNKKAAQMVGEFIADRCLAKGVDRVAFDRSGFRYHGRISSLADAARGKGLKF